MKVPEHKRRHSALFQAACALGTVALLLSSYSNAAEWKVLPRLRVLETYSDNLRMTRNDNGSGDLITQINPGLSVSSVARRFSLDADYTMNNLIYAEASNFNRIRHQLNATATTELIEDLFFVDGRARIRQQNVSLLGPQSFDNVNVTGNRADVRTFSVSPYLRHRFQNFASAELRYTRSLVTSNANSLFNSSGDSFSGGLNSGTAFQTLSWGVNYSNQMVHFDRNDRTVEMERTIANLGYRITPQFGLTASGGYERNSFISIRGNPSSPTWTVGFFWNPSERTSIVANAGQRFFGDTYFVLANHRTRMTVWDVSYSEDITTFNQQAQAGAPINLAGSLGQLLGAQNPTFSPGLIQENSGALLGLGASGAFFDPNNFFTNRLFLQKRFQASVAMNGTRNTLVFRVFNMTRKAFSPESVDVGIVGAENLALLNHTRQSGANAMWSYRLSNLTRANVNFGYSRFSFLGHDREDDFMLSSISLTRQFPQILRNLNGMIMVRHNERDSNRPGGNYRENAALASLSISF
ncbi:uncharacterized protein, PEP-CTERM system associated [Nitrosospira briensis]|uniref:Uncharacterized protein, PEP-CTERM system associated n=1 Tax=Nitrosospira briensis TaxID=35799 RepID=A0A1I5BW57_9PROT|nr:TIGR03016 family PEP-CTERM system-associated outer membrane protein [Nitrosospira briensis]SFN78852.1 uncharacterized protein, PEP-CTERM system associated [Nitrosospira briensis]